MPINDTSRVSPFAATLFLLVATCLLLPVGALIADSIAIGTGGSLPPEPVVVSDPLSDTVAATAAEFRVDESGAATYSIPIYTVPGTAGVVPTLSFNYSSQAGDGAIGKGWSIGGLSSISRCRATREAGDFIVDGVSTDGNPSPIVFTDPDRYCLDGQRLLRVADGASECPMAGGMEGAPFRTEIESFQRVCAYASSDGAGPKFFTVERKDGSISWYGDRDQSDSANRPDGYFNSTVPGKEAAALSWAQTRFQDSTGNYINFYYWKNANGVYGEHFLGEVQYTGKKVLPGQTGSDQAPYARIVFNYALLPAARQAKGYLAGGLLTQAHQLHNVQVISDGQEARYYRLNYALSQTGSNRDTLTSLQECRDSSMQLCLPATTFTWSEGRHEFATVERPADLTFATDHIRGFKTADINGDGRQDIALLYLAGSGCVGAPG